MGETEQIKGREILDDRRRGTDWEISLFSMIAQCIDESMKEMLNAKSATSRRKKQQN